MTQPNPKQVQLKRSLSLPLVSLYGVGTILGAGIYVLVGKVAGLAGLYTPIAFILAACLAGLSAFSYAELSARFPKSAGEAVYVREGFGSSRFATLIGLLIVLVGVLSTATLLHGFVGYLGILIDLPETVVIICMCLLLGLVVIWGISESVILASLMTVVEIVGLLLVLWVARDGFASLPQKLPDLLPGFDAVAWTGILLGGFIAFYAFIGFEDIVNVAEEVKQPRRNLPRAILAALLITTAFYFAVSTLSVLYIPPVELAQSDAPLALIYTRATGQTAIVISLISMISVLNGALIQVIMASRVLYGLSRSGWIPALLGYVSPVTRTPTYAISFTTLIVLFFALWLPLLSLAWLTSFVTLTIFATINLALWQIKHRGVEPCETINVPIWLPLVGFLASTAFVLFQVYDMLR